MNLRTKTDFTNFVWSICLAGCVALSSACSDDAAVEDQNALKFLQDSYGDRYSFEFDYAPYFWACAKIGIDVTENEAKEIYEKFFTFDSDSGEWRETKFYLMNVCQNDGTFVFQIGPGLAVNHTPHY